LSRFDLKARVVAHGQVGPQIYILGLRAPEITRAVRPGQFCMLDPKPPGAHDPLLRRPFSVHRVGPKGLLVFMYKIVGRGTAIMSRLVPGDILKVLGPLGNGFSIDRDRPGLLVAGGIGIAPMVYLAESWPQGLSQAVVLGGRTDKELRYGIRCLEDTSAKVFVATEDGSLGERGLVTGLLPEALSFLKKDPVIYACGPWPMLRAVAVFAEEKGLLCQVSLEAHMACGLGLCLGCTIKSNSGKYLHVCMDGPVFSKDQIDWDAPL